MQAVVQREVLRSTGKTLPRDAIQLVYHGSPITPESPHWPTRERIPRYHVVIRVAGSSFIRFRSRHKITSERSVVINPAGFDIDSLKAVVVASLQKEGVAGLDAKHVAFEHCAAAKATLVRTSEQMMALRGNQVWVVNMKRAPEGTVIEFSDSRTTVQMDVSMLTFGQIRRLVHDRMSNVAGVNSGHLRLIRTEEAGEDEVHTVDSLVGARKVRVEWVRE